MWRPYEPCLENEFRTLLERLPWLCDLLRWLYFTTGHAK